MHLAISFELLISRSFHTYRIYSVRYFRSSPPPLRLIKRQLHRISVPALCPSIRPLCTISRGCSRPMITNIGYRLARGLTRAADPAILIADSELLTSGHSVSRAMRGWKAGLLTPVVATAFYCPTEPRVKCHAVLLERRWINGDKFLGDEYTHLPQFRKKQKNRQLRKFSECLSRCDLDVCLIFLSGVKRRHPVSSRGYWGN